MGTEAAEEKTVAGILESKIGKKGTRNACEYIIKSRILGAAFCISWPENTNYMGYRPLLGAYWH